MLTFILLSALSVSEENYQRSLRIAEQKVIRQKSELAGTASALSNAGPSVGQAYKVGDSWEVAALHYESSMMNKVARPENATPKNKVIGIFRYEVTAVKDGSVQLKVTQREAYGQKVVDPKVKSLFLTMNDRVQQTGKAYQLNKSNQMVSVSAQGVRSKITLLELFPLDVPEVPASIREPAKDLPELPAELEQVAEQAGYSPRLSDSFWFEQDDLFGRPVQFLWEKGRPWPTYLKTPQGVAVLVRKEAS